VRGLLRPTAAVVVPLILQAVWVEFLVHRGPVRGASAALSGGAAIVWWLSVPGCAIVALFFGYRLIVRDHPDPRLDFAFVYFATGMLSCSVSACS
jgi:hypothetical protein